MRRATFRAASYLAMLAAVGMAASSCSLLGDDGDAISEVDDAPTAVTSSSSTQSSEQPTQPTGERRVPESTPTTPPPPPTPPTSVGPISTGPNSTLAEVLQSGFCDAPQRNWFEVTFAPGASSQTIDSAAIAGQVDMYEVETDENQILYITLAPNNADAVATLFQPDATTVVGAFTETAILETLAGSYWICVTSGDSGTGYRLTVSVIDDNTPSKVDAPWCGSDVNYRGELRILPDRYATEVENAVIRAERDLYRFAATEGQALYLFFTSPESNAVFDLRTPSGEILIDEVSDFRTPLPESGTYEICVGGTRGNASYELNIDIG